MTTQKQVVKRFQTNPTTKTTKICQTNWFNKPSLEAKRNLIYKKFRKKTQNLQQKTIFTLQNTQLIKLLTHIQMILRKGTIWNMWIIFSV